jgi:hypothetical protein
MSASTQPTNRLASVSFLSTLLAVFAFCIGVIPIPMTAPICYPVAVIFGLVALVTGLVSLRQIRASGEAGRTLALIGISAGSLTILAVICLTVLTLYLLLYGAGQVESLWPQLRP